MNRSPRALWNLLSPSWQGFVREAEAFAGDTPTAAELARAFARPSFDLGVLDGDAAADLDLAPLAWFAELTELRVYGGLSLATLPRLPRLAMLSTEGSALPDDLGARLPRLVEATLVPLARHAAAYQGLRRLAELTVETGRGIDLAALVHLPALRHLRMVEGPARQVPTLAALRKLDTLDLRYTKVSELAPLAALRRLRSLDLSCTAVTALAPLAKLTALETLSLFGCTRVDDLRPLRALTRLQSLDLTATRVDDLAPLARLARLRTLDVSSTRVSDLSPLARLPELAEITAYATPIRDLAPLAARAATLTALDLRATEVVDVRPLHALRRLARVNLEQTAVPYTELETLGTRLPKATILGAKRPLAHFPGALDATLYAVVKSLFDAERILRGAGVILIAETYLGRPGDWPYAIQRMTFAPKSRLWTLWLDDYGTATELKLWGPRDVCVGPDEFTIGGAAKITYRGKRCAVDARTAFRMA